MRMFPGACFRRVVLPVAVSAVLFASGLVAPRETLAQTGRIPLPTPTPVVIGHAGSGFFTPLLPFNPLPPSSLRSIRRALQHQAQGVEVDVRLSQDSIPVLYHNQTLHSMSDGQGCVSQTPAVALQQLRYRGGWPYDWFQREKIITFETVLQELAQRRSPFPYLHLDLHEDDPCAADDQHRSRALARRLVSLLNDYHVPVERVLILTNKPGTLVYLHQLQPALPLGLEITEDYEEAVSAMAGLPVQAVVLPKRAVTPERVAQLHALGQEVVVFGGRSRKAIRRVVGCRPDAYEVDDVRRLRAVLGSGASR